MSINHNTVEQLKRDYPVGTRIMLDYMAKEEHPIPPGTIGTVTMVDDIGTIHCKFDNGRNLGICSDIDEFHKI